MDFYHVLEINRNSTQEDIKKSYKNLSKKFHPDRPEGDEAKFKKISEAYETLSDPEKKRKYDVELNGINIGIKGNDRNTGQFRSNRATFEHFFNMGSGSGGVKNTRMMVNPHIQYTIEIKLEELYLGTTKKFKIKRYRICKETGELKLEDKLLDVVIGAGFLPGNSLIIQGEGNQYHTNLPPGNIILHIKEINNTLFKRKGGNLVYIVKISLRRALCGFQLNIIHLDGRKINITIDEIIRPGMEHIIKNEGMPDYHNKEQKGALIIAFDVDFPKELSKDTKIALFKLLE